MANSQEHLKYFLDCYLSASEGSLAQAVRELAEGEPQVVGSLIQELGPILAGDVDGLRQMIRRRGNYYVPDGVSPREMLVQLREELQQWYPPRLFSMPFDVGISYNSVDQQAANTIYEQLKTSGFKVRLDDWGDASHTSGAAQVSAFGSSDVVLILTSPLSAQSWARTDLPNALKETARLQVRVVPVRLANCQLPATLEGFRRIDLFPDLQARVRLLMRDLEVFRTRPRLLSDLHDDHEPLDLPPWVVSFYQDSEAACKRLGWPPAEAHKDVVVARLGSDAGDITKPDLQELIDSCRVRLMNWGGDAFPMDTYPTTKVSTTQTGFRMANTSNAGFFYDWAFSFMEVDERGILFHRTSVDEDHINEFKGVKTRVLGVEWLIKDVCTPLLFAQRLATNLAEPDVMVWLRWIGLRDRRLHKLYGGSAPVPSGAAASEDEFTATVVVGPSSNLQSTAAAVVDDVLRLFQWTNYPKDAVAGQIEQMLNGSFPRA